MYSLDTSAFISAWNEHYAPDVFPVFWDFLDTLIEEGRVVCSEEVARELERKSDELYSWVKERAHNLFTPTDEEVLWEAKRIMARFPKLAKHRQTVTVADPFVITVSRINGYTVVTYERNGTEQRPKIPNVCQELGVDWCTLLSMLRKERGRFR